MRIQPLLFQIVTLLCIAFISIKCQPDRQINSLDKNELSRLGKFQALDVKSNIQIAEASEPGEKLLLCLTFVDKKSKKPLYNQDVLFYHTSASGEYEPSDPLDESTARLSGTGITDEHGRIFIKTILPGDYGSSSDNRHIHTTVKGAKPEAYDIHFKQYTGAMGKNFIDGSDQHFLADLYRNASGELVTFLTIEVKN